MLSCAFFGLIFASEPHVLNFSTTATILCEYSSSRLEHSSKMRGLKGAAKGLQDSTRSRTKPSKEGSEVRQTLEKQRKHQVQEWETSQNGCKCAVHCG